MYLGEHVYLRRRTAIKVLHTSLEDEDVNKFLAEAQTLGRLTHPNIVQVFDFADDTFVARLTADLQQRGITASNEDPDRTQHTLEQEGEVRQAIRAADVVLLVVTPHARSSRTVKEVAFLRAGAASGGGVYNTSLALKFTVINSTIAGNTASNGPGGGIFASSSVNGKSILTMTNSTIGENTTSSSGGGIAFSGSQATITFCTFYANTATQDGGGIFVEDTTTPSISGNVELSRSLVAGNQAGRGLDIAGAFTTGGYNLIQNFSGATFDDPLNKHSTDISGDIFPNLGIGPVLRDNSGPTKTLALLPGSPAIDKIPRGACHVKGITTDQQGIIMSGCQSATALTNYLDNQYNLV